MSLPRDIEGLAGPGEEYNPGQATKPRPAATGSAGAAAGSGP